MNRDTADAALVASVAALGHRFGLSEGPPWIEDRPATRIRIAR